jgi:hypothetical protein
MGPLVDISEDDHEYLIKAELSGIQHADRPRVAAPPRYGEA